MHNRQLALLFLTVFIDLIGFGIVFPLLPYFAESLGANAFVIGLFIASFSLMQFIFCPIWGRLSDKIGRRPVILIGILCSAFTFWLFGISKSLTMLFISRLLNGALTAATLPTAQAYIADSTKPQERTKAFGWLGAAFGLGFIFGPALGGLLAFDGFALPAYVASGLSVLNFFGALLWLPETHPKEKRGKMKGKMFDLKDFYHALRHPSIGTLIIVFSLVSFAFSNYYAMVALFSENQLHITVRGMGLIMALTGACSALIQGVAINRIVNMYGEKKTLITGLGCMTIGLFLIPFSFSITTLAVYSSILAIGFALCNPTVTALISKNTTEAEQGGIMGIFHGCGSLARVFGPFYGGYAFGTWGHSAPFFGGTVVMIAAVLLAGYGIKPKKEH